MVFPQGVLKGYCGMLEHRMSPWLAVPSLSWGNVSGAPDADVLHKTAAVACCEAFLPFKVKAQHQRTNPSFVSSVSAPPLSVGIVFVRCLMLRALQALGEALFRIGSWDADSGAWSPSSLAVGRDDTRAATAVASSNRLCLGRVAVVAEMHERFGSARSLRKPCTSGQKDAR